MTTVANALSKNRAEELGYDVWSSFVVPPFFAELGIYETKKPKLIIGGRGCGKTMLLRYLSHQSSFSPDRKTITDQALKHIGLYWRADTQFANAMQKRNIEPETWTSAFDHFASLLIAIEVLRSLHSIAQSAFESFTLEDLAGLRFHSLRAFDQELPVEPEALEKALEFRLNMLETWVSDVKKAEEPTFFPATKFVTTLLRDLKSQVPSFQEATFFVYVDEYENLVEYQQELVNTWVKSSEHPLIYNLAMKRNGFRTRKTVGVESLSDIHDFRQHDIENLLADDFSMLAAEILVLRLAETAGALTVDVARLNDPSCLAERAEAGYKQRIIREVERLLPDVTEEQLASEVFAEKALSQKLRERIESALKLRTSELAVDIFFRPEHPRASIITPALLFRRSLTPEDIAAELDTFSAGKVSKFDNWIHNNFVGCLLQLYGPFSRACPFYAGFNTFCQLAHGNVRYFLELCYRCLARSEALALTPIEVQAEIARQASAAFLKEVRSFGSKGNQLYSFVLGLGSLFALAHIRDTQSESEQTHFFVKEGHRGLASEDAHFLGEAIKWSVLFESPATKQKSEYEPEGNDYTLNPIYAPYFHISYRKRRKLELSADDLHILIHGEYSQRSDLLKRYRNNWSISTGSLPLFSHLEDQ